MTKMDTSDKVILGICVGCLLIGLLQHSITTRQHAAEPSGTNKQPTSATAEQEPSLLQEKPNNTQTQYHIVNDLPKPGEVVMQKSRYKQKTEAMQERQKNKEKWDPREDPDYFQIREGYKKRILDDPTSTLTDKEKWEIIESNAIPW
jgi:hypothetical protein